MTPNPRRAFSSILIASASFILAGCAKSIDADRHAETPIGDMGLASGGAPAADLTYVSDQLTVKLVSVPQITYEPLESFRGAKHKGAGSQPAEGGDESGGDTGAAEAKDPLSAAKNVFSALTGGHKAGKPKEAGDDKGKDKGNDEDKSAEAPDETTEPAKPAKGAKSGGEGEAATDTLETMEDQNDTVPEHPSKLVGEQVETAKKDALADAKAKLAKRVFGLHVVPVTTVADAVGKQGDPSKLELNSAFMVSAKWLDPNHLEVVVMCRLSDIVDELTSKFPKADVSPLRSLAQDKGLSGKGIGQIKAESTKPKMAKPGERAKRATEGF